MDVIPEHILRLMSDEDRAKLGKAGITAAEAEARRQRRVEKEMHDTFGQWLRMREIYHVHSRMDKPATIAKGTPDFIILHEGKARAVEFKTEEGRLSKDQVEHLEWLTKTKTPWRVCRSAQEAIDWVAADLLQN